MKKLLYIMSVTNVTEDERLMQNLQDALVHFAMDKKTPKTQGRAILALIEYLPENPDNEA